MKTYRQGDVLFREIEAIPSGESKKRETGHILEGEATGHVHRVKELDSADVIECGDGLYLSVTAEGGVSIVHDEHDTLTLPAGNYEVVRQREYSPEAIRNVED
jgi:hypothetical protein